ncbi:unnamed protein product [Gadus morhua 'NCC']
MRELIFLVHTAVFLMLEVLVQGDTQVGCVFGGSCEMPCHFQPNSDTILHWVKKDGEIVQVHSYYDDQDQLGHQDPLYKGRTSLFHDQISGGNASLGLARVNLQDQGRYLCYASTSQYNQETFVNLTVRAPVVRVDIRLVNNTVTCQSRGIYPRPQLTWSVSPRPATVLQNTTEVHEDDQGLYDITGSLRTVNNDTESTYSCSVQNEHSAREATKRLHRLDDITWTFNHNQTILRRQAGQEKVVETEWQQHVRNLSESGSLLLYVTSSAQSEGTYRCTLRYADEEEVTHIELKILEDPIADTQVGCVFGGSCVLPCRFQPNSDTILHWGRINGKIVQVHSYYDKLDQLGYQDPLYKGRTSLFHDQISGGNASLGLTRVNLQDQGRYLCYASTSKNNQETFVTLTVTAPVTRVDIVLLNNTVTCKSRGIYPRPKLTWSVSPRPATVHLNTLNVHKDVQGLYDITGSLKTIYNDTDSAYSCSVQNGHSARKATIRQHPPMQSAPGSEVLLPCDASGLDDITWTFNHHQTILRRQAGQEVVVETEWQQHVRDLSESGSLLLYVTSSAQSEGTYRCTLRYADGEDVTHIELKILEDPVEGRVLVKIQKQSLRCYTIRVGKALSGLQYS